jgi:hypothetical protein
MEHRTSLALSPLFSRADTAAKGAIERASRSQRLHSPASDVRALLGIALSIVLGGSLWLFLGTAVVLLMGRQ